MGAEQPLRGTEITLPVCCAGSLDHDEDVPCRADAEVAVWGDVIGQDGRPMWGLVTVCRRHVRKAVLMMKSAAVEPDDVQVWRLEVFVQQQGLIVRELGAPVEHLRPHRVA